MLQSAEYADKPEMSSVIRDICSMVKDYSLFFHYEYKPTEYVRR